MRGRRGCALVASWIALTLAGGGFGCGERFNHQISHEQKVEVALDALDARLSAIEGRLTKIEGRLTRLEGKGAPDGGARDDTKAAP